VRRAGIVVTLAPLVAPPIALEIAVAAATLKFPGSHPGESFGTKRKGKGPTMGLFDLFGGKNDKGAARPEPVPTGKAAPGTAISYDASLVPKLTQDHRQLVDIYKQVQAALARNDLKGVRDRLQQFRGALQEHLLAENVKLYVYLARNVANDEDSSQLVNDMRREMMGIGRVVMDFLRKYTETPINPAEARQFKTELDGIGSALVQRIQREESALYPLYLPSY
jgi:regulator of sigma D